MFFATCTSVFLVYLFSWQRGSVFDEPTLAARALVFTATLMGILLAHELGHYGVARLHGFRLSMPWFLPFPFLVGTLGAIIRLQDVPRSRTGLLEMGAAGPLAGLVVIVLVVAAWLLGEPAPVTGEPWSLARPPLFWLLSLLLTGGAPPAISTQDPMAFAAWIGCLVTAMNLLPFGQLDGGHVTSAMFPRLAPRISWAVTGLLIFAGVGWLGWLAWAVLLNLLGTREPVRIPPEKDHTPPTVRARRVGFACVLAFLLCFTPIPIR